MARSARLEAYLGLILAMTAGAACDDGSGRGSSGRGQEVAPVGPDAAPDAPPPDAAPPDAQPPDAAPDAGPTLPRLKADDQSLALSTEVQIAAVETDAPCWLAVHAGDDADAPGEVLGFVRLPAGAHEAVALALARPARDGESLFAVLHEDAGERGRFDFPGPDGPIADPVPFRVAVPADSPAVRLTLSSIDASAFDFITVEPDTLAGETVGAADALSGDQTLTLRPGWRYEIVNTVAGAHPFELITDGTPGAEDDRVQTSPDLDPAQTPLEREPGVAWQEADGRMRFTVTRSFRTLVDAYRCGIHVATMRGAVRYAE
jgi:hypothetical protein